MHGLKVNTDRYPGALMYTEFDNNGDLDRMSFLVEVKNGKQEVVAMLPPLNAATSSMKTTLPATMGVAAKAAVKK